MLYEGEEEYLAGTVPHIRAAAEADQPVLVAVGEEKRQLLEGALDGLAEAVRFVDMAELGRNPARVLPVWREFADRDGSGRRGALGIGEPVWPGRTPEEVVECQHHEALLNLAFLNSPSWSLICTYDAKGLDDEVLEAARRTHPYLVESRIERESELYGGLAAAPWPFEPELPEPAATPERFELSAERLSEARHFVAPRAAEAGLDEQRTGDLLVAITELATNTVRYGRGRGELRVWRENGDLLCEVRDPGRIEDPLVGRRRPRSDQLAGRGLWLVNQLCDLVQIRSGSEGSAVRVRMRAG